VNSIQQWLSGKKDWAVGVALYNAHGDHELFKQALKQGKSPYRRERLIELLKKLADKQPEAPKVAQEPQLKKVVVGKLILPENRIAEDQDIYRGEWLPIYKEMMNLHARMEDMKPDERGKAAHEILRLERTMRYIWWKRDYHLKYKEKIDDEKPTVQVTDANAIRLKLQNARSYRSKVEKLLITQPMNERLLTRLDKYKREIANLEKRLGYA